MSSQAKIAKNLEVWTKAIKHHNEVLRCTEPVWGIGLCGFDILRLDLELGEEILPGVRIEERDGIAPDRFRLLCDASEPPETPEGLPAALEVPSEAGVAA